MKTKKEAGADNLTPSKPQYFSWINNTNEGSTEEQTLANLEFFRYMKETYGMQIEIYAWDAGNFDGAREGYGSTDSEKFRSQYPEGYKNVAAKAKELGIKMGLWGSPDGFGDDPETEKKRFDFFVHLCRDYGFGLFKLDGVCGPLRPEKGKLFSDMLVKCREYVPDLIVLNHRLDLYEAEKNVTTYLWNGQETYTDVLSCNEKTCMHHRGYLFNRGLTDNLERLAEDHGVCISSCIDYFEDELVYQAFGRCLILAPEIYGNPWLMKDSELPVLAYIYNLHRRYADILVNGMRLPEEYGPYAVSRGTDARRIICTGNSSWEEKTLRIKIGEVTGIKQSGSYRVTRLFPYVENLGTFSFGDTVPVTLAPFRAALFEIAEVSQAYCAPEGRAFEIIKEDKDGKVLEYREITEENTARAPVFLGTLKKSTEHPSAEFLYETAVFAADNDALEYRTLLRSGKTEIPCVKKCRDAFFGQETYRLRGCENRNLFDGRDDTFFDSQTKTYWGERMRINGGCLRIDLGEVCDIDEIQLDAFFSDTETNEVLFNTYPEKGSFSADLLNYYATGKAEIISEKAHTQKVIRFSVHDFYSLDGKIKTVSYGIGGAARYIRLPSPPDRIFNVRFYKNGREIRPAAPRANNMFSPFDLFGAGNVQCLEVTLPDSLRSGSYIAVATEGKCGTENVFVCAESNGVFYGCPDRAPSYRSNVWEHLVTNADGYYTHYLPADDFRPGDRVKIYAVYAKASPEIRTDVYLCENKDRK